MTAGARLAVGGDLANVAVGVPVTEAVVGVGAGGYVCSSLLETGVSVCSDVVLGAGRGVSVACGAVEPLASSSASLTCTV